MTDPNAGAWTKRPEGPVLDDRHGVLFDVCLLKEDGRYRMWVSWKGRGIGLVESPDGVAWSDPVLVLPPTGSGWEDEVNRPIVLRDGDGYRMWYTGQTATSSDIGTATSPDGVAWERRATPVLRPDQPWEAEGLMCPHVLFEDGEYRMWYSGGGLEEPVAIGYATSPDGVNWTKRGANPVLAPNPGATWERERTTGAQIVRHEGWTLAFYIGFEDIDTARIGLARSRDGITGWERHPANPIVVPTPGGWDADACYKPFALLEGGGWRLWYNGRRGDDEQIGLVTHEEADLGF